MDFIWRQRGEHEFAVHQGKTKWMKRGREEGREQAQFDIAQRLLAAGMMPQQAADMTGIAVERLY